jgi:P-type Cu2+ transporter
VHCVVFFLVRLPWSKVMERTHAHPYREHTGDGERERAPHRAGQAHSAHEGHDKHAGHSPEMFRRKFWLSFVLTIPVVFWSDHIQELLGYQAPVFPGSDWIPPVLGTVIFFYGGWIFIQGAWHELKARLPGMMTLISLAITVAFLFSWVAVRGRWRRNQDLVELRPELQMEPASAAGYSHLACLESTTPQ